MYTGGFAPYHTRADLGLVCDIRIIARIFDHAAAALMGRIATRMQSKGDLLPYGQANRHLRNVLLIEERVQGSLHGGGRTGPCGIAGAEGGWLLHTSLPMTRSANLSTLSLRSSSLRSAAKFLEGTRFAWRIFVRAADRV